MIRDITIGQYYPGESAVHTLDPRTKINITLMFIISLFIKQGFVSYGIALIALLSVIITTTIPVKFMLRGLKSVFIIIVLTVGLNLFLTPGIVILVDFGFATITLEGLKLAFFMGVRLMMLIVGSSLLTLTTSPITLTDGIEALLKPLERIRVPSHEIAMMMTIALRFIPILLEETDKIMKAQMARGADFESGGIVKKARNMVPLLVPLFISSFRRADDLALAMEARCYRGGEGRTRMKQLRYGRNDLMAYTVTAVYFLMIVASAVISL